LTGGEFSTPAPHPLLSHKARSTCLCLVKYWLFCDRARFETWHARKSYVPSPRGRRAGWGSDRWVHADSNMDMRANNHSILSTIKQTLESNRRSCEIATDQVKNGKRGRHKENTW